MVRNNETRGPSASVGVAAKVATYTIERQVHTAFNPRGVSGTHTEWQIKDGNGEDVDLCWRLKRDAVRCCALLNSGELVADNGLDLQAQFDRYRWDRGEDF